MKEDISNELSTVRHSEIKRELIILDELERCINGKGKIYKVNQQMWIEQRKYNNGERNRKTEHAT